MCVSAALCITQKPMAYGMFRSFALMLLFILAESHVSYATPMEGSALGQSSGIAVVTHKRGWHSADSVPISGYAPVTSPKEQLILWCLFFYKECAQTHNYINAYIEKHNVWDCQSNGNLNDLFVFGKKIQDAIDAKLILPANMRPDVEITDQDVNLCVSDQDFFFFFDVVDAMISSADVKTVQEVVYSEVHTYWQNPHLA